VVFSSKLRYDIFEWRCGKEYRAGWLRNCCQIETFRVMTKCSKE
jgi:hypothetical protein